MRSEKKFQNKDSMSADSWNANWSLNYNPVFTRLVSLTTSYYQRRISQMFARNKVRGRKILELGCGTGSDTAWIMKTFGFEEGHLVDYSEEALTKAELLNGDSSFTYIQKNILKLKLREKYDLVHSGFVVEHFYGRDREKIFKKHAEFVKDKGFVFIQIPCKTPLSFFYSKTVNKLNGIDELPYTQAEVYALCRKANLEIRDSVFLFGNSILFLLLKKILNPQFALL